MYVCVCVCSVCLVFACVIYDRMYAGLCSGCKYAYPSGQKRFTPLETGYRTKQSILCIRYVSQFVLIVLRSTNHRRFNRAHKANGQADSFNGQRPCTIVLSLSGAFVFELISRNDPIIPVLFEHLHISQIINTQIRLNAYKYFTVLHVRCPGVAYPNAPDIDMFINPA